jgi:hypothetical protein
MIFSFCHGRMKQDQNNKWEACLLFMNLKRIRRRIVTYKALVTLIEDVVEEDWEIASKSADPMTLQSLPLL